MKEAPIVLVVLVGAIVTALAVLVLPIRYTSHYYDKTYCPAKLESLGRQGKFVDYNFFEWQCLAKTDQGTYVTIDRLLNVSQDE